MPRCSLIIRCHNEEQHIGRLLSGVMQQTVRDVEIIVVDSGSTDATVSIASRYPVRILTILKEEFSFGRSLNIGCRAATAEFLIIASAHVYPLAIDWIEKMLEPFADPKVGLVYGKQRGNEVTKFSEHQVFRRWFPDRSNPRQEHPFCNNANAAIRKSLWSQIPYDEDLTGLEDLDWATKVLKSGYYLAYAAGAPVAHVHDETPSRLYNRYKREAIAFKRIFPSERFHFFDFLTLFVTNTITDYYHAIEHGLFWRNIRSIPQFRLLQFWGTYRGYALHGSVTRGLRETFYYPNDLFGGSLEQEVVKPDTIIDYTKQQHHEHGGMD